ncbi:hypothetical protein RDWZM_001138 [Blomia tropicalis]|uniref:Intraflagellar transport protein 57 homolog n=1 Tax=Blomia tropicalis TaxID=40697 RepID=A0A9Q0RNN4_BLOTA|nr:hypothetical protein RDWZM_001138 [Blomia tropicalis]
MSARKNELDDHENSSAQLVSLFQAMYDLHDKLLAIDYDKEFVTQYKCPSINRYYFVKQGNVAQQFFAFCSLSSYLINKLTNKNDFKVDGFDDPNLTIDKILNASQSFVDISNYVNVRQKFKQGHGYEVIGLLNKLVDKVCLEKLSSNQNGQVKVTFYGADGIEIQIDEEDDDDMDAEDNEIELEEEFADYIIVDDGNIEEDNWDEPNVTDSRENAMIIAKTDLTEWKLELERILPQLNARHLGQSMYQSGAYDNEWRLHYKAALVQKSNISKVFGQTCSMVGQLSGDIKQALDKIETKENYLRENSSTILAEWSTVRDRANKLSVAYESVNKEIRDKSERLTELNDEDRTTKQAIEEYSLKMTDSSPLVEAKKAREHLKQELVNINLQIGVAIQTLVRHISLNTSSVYQ